MIICREAANPGIGEVLWTPAACTAGADEWPLTSAA